MGVCGGVEGVSEVYVEEFCEVFGGGEDFDGEV